MHLFLSKVSAAVVASSEESAAVVASSVNSSSSYDPSSTPKERGRLLFRVCFSNI